MKKIFAIILSLGLAVALTACQSGTAASSTSTAAKEYNLADVVTAVEAVNPVANPRTIDDFSIENDFLLNADDVVEYSGEMSNDQGNSALVLAVKCTAGKAETVQTALETYKQNQVAYYGNYAEFAAGQACIENGRVVTKGDYVVIVFANTDGADYTQIDSAISTAMD